MHSLFKKVTLWGLASMLAVGLVAFPNTARRVDAKGGYDSSQNVANIDAQISIDSNIKGSVLSAPTLPPPPAGATTFVGRAALWNYYAHATPPGNFWIKC